MRIKSSLIGFNKDFVFTTLLTSMVALGCATSSTANAATEIVSGDKKLHLRGITITPGGYFSFTGIYRSRAIQSDYGSTFSIPLGNNPLYYIDELRFSARETRLSLLVEGRIDPATLASGYVEIDFLGTGTANSITTDSYNPRIRQAWGNIDWEDSGWHFLFGQTWSLVTTNNKGITPRNEVIPPTIESNYVPGFLFKRQPGVRLVKNWGPSIWAAVSAENPQNTVGGSSCGIITSSNGDIATSGTAFDGVLNEFCQASGQSSYPSSTNYSFNAIPDIIGKIAYEPVWAGHKMHLEAIALYRDLYDRVWYTNGDKTNIHNSGYGFGGGGIIEAWPKFIDIQANAMAGKGLGSYGAASLPDFTLGFNGGPAPLDEVIYMVGATVHATPDLDIYVFGGKEQVDNNYFQVLSGTALGSYIGYGIPTANNLGCVNEGGTCQGNTQSIWQVTSGLWDIFYKGDFGQMKVGLQYSYTKRILFDGNGGLQVGADSVGYNADEQMGYLSFRYLPFYQPAVKAVYK